MPGGVPVLVGEGAAVLATINVRDAGIAECIALWHDLSTMCPSSGIFGGFFGNASVGAFFGSATAFFLVIVNDRRRMKRRARCILPALLRRENVLVENRIATTPNTQQEVASGRLKEHKSQIFAFDTIRRHAEELPDFLAERQTMALYNIALSMQTADELNARAISTVQRINEAKLSGAERIQGGPSTATLSTELDREYRTELSQLKNVRDLIKAYLEGTLDEYGGPSPGATKRGGTLFLKRWHSRSGAADNSVSPSASGRTLHLPGYWLHWVALLFEAFGSLLVFLEARRFNVILTTAVFHVDYAGGAPLGYRDWWHNSGALGFGLLLTGILLGGIALFIDRRRD